MNDERETKQCLTFRAFSWPGVLLSIAIIAIRSFQPNAQPIEDWSILSWCMMLVPAFFPFLIWIALVFFWLVSNVLYGIFVNKP